MDANRLATLRSLDQAHYIHPFTNHGDLHARGTHVMQAGKGCFLTDETGRSLLDGLAGLWCVNVGYGNEEIADAVHKQLLQLSFYPSFFNTTTEPAILLAEKISSYAPAHLNKVFFSNSGSEANESALKVVRGYNKLRGRSRKTKILSRTFGYHGVTLAATSMTGLTSCTEPFDLPLPGFIHVPGPHAYGVDSDLSPAEYGEWCLDETARVIDREGAETIAALFAEPIQGAGGVIPPPPGYLERLRALCKERDILFVADEVITGFGRLGDWYASTLWKLEPDLMILAKGISSGYVPLGATVVSDAIADALESGGYFAHGFTYSGHPVAAAAGLANLRIIERERLVEYVRDDIGPYFQGKLQAFAGHPAVGEIRGYQLLGAIDMLPRGGKPARKAPHALGDKAAALIREQGVIVRGIRDLIAIAPPMTVTRAELDRLFQAVGYALDRLWD